MSEAALKVILSADGTQLTKTLEDLEKDLKDFKAQLAKTTDVNAIGKLNQQITQTERAMKSVQKLRDPFAKVTVGSNQAAQSLNDLSRIVQDAPYGFMAISNNLNPALESFQRLRAETGSTKLALSQLASSLAGPVGVGLALSLVSTLAIRFGDDISKAFKSVNKEAERLNEVFGGAEGGFAKASATVNELAINIDLAKKGFLDKNDVVRQYNETLGKATGEVKSLDEAEKALIKNGDAYVKMMLYKAVANQALEAAAKKAFEAEQARVKKESEYVKTFDKVSFTTLTSAPGALPSNLIAQSERIGRAARVAAQQRRKKEAVDSAQSESNTLLEIAKNFQRQAAEISKNFNLDFFGFTDPKKKAARLKGEKEVFDLMQRIKKMMLDIDFSFVPRIPENAGKDYVKAFSDQLKEEFTRGIPVAAPFVLSFKDTQEINRYTDAANFKKVGEAIGRQIAPGFDKVFGEQFQKSLLLFSKGKSHEQIQSFKASLQAVSVVAVDMFNGVANAFDAMFEAIAKGGNALQAFGNKLIQTITGVISKLIQAAVLAAILSAISGGVAKGGTSFLGAFKGILGAGMPNVGMGVNYAADRMGSISGIGSNSFNISGELRVRGSDLVLAYNREARSQNRRF